jgi:uncharacterized protein (DUF433 family)
MTLKWQDHIEEREDVMLGKPVFKGTRLTVGHILCELGTGMTPAELFDSYPNLKPGHIPAALQYAADVVAMDEVTSSSPSEAGAPCGSSPTSTCHARSWSGSGTRGTTYSTRQSRLPRMKVGVFHTPYQRDSQGLA